MAVLISPGTDVQIVATEFSLPTDASALPLIFIATADEKTQADGLTPAIGTYEHGVLRTVTSLKQALELYGVPKFYTSASGQAHHGDARNEYGLDALLKFLEVGNRAYVVRANVNLNDNITDIRALWAAKTADAADYLNTLVTDWLVQYNTINGFVPVDVGYKTSVSKAVLETLVAEALAATLSSFSFSKDAFANALLNDHSVARAGYQDVVFESFSGYLQGIDITGLDELTTYTASVEITAGSGTAVHELTFTGADVTTFADLVAAINTVLGADGVASLIQGRIRIASTLTGVTSAVEIISEGDSSLAQPLFTSLNLFDYKADPIAGTGVALLDVYNNAYDTLTGSYDGVFGTIADWTTGTEVGTEFTGNEAEGLLLASVATFDNTKEFKDGISLGANDALRRVTISQQIQAVINNPNTNVRNEALEFDLVAAPGFPEVTDELVRLTTFKYEEVQVIGETPFDKPATGPNSIATWALSAGKVSSKHVAYYYGHGITSNIDGADIMSTAATTGLRTIAYSDSVSGSPASAAAGVTRGVCPHLSDIGYVSGTLGGPTTFVTDYLDNGTRDELYEYPKNINPITFIAGRGFLVMGQKTTSPTVGPEDRLNVARLSKKIKRVLRKALFSYLFEPNDAITRKNVKASADNYLSSLVSRRELYDFATVCDLSNNDATALDNHELYLDIAIKPVETVEFIYARIRLVNPSTNIGTGR